MLVHIRRSIVLAAVALVLTFAYAFLGTGVSQLLFTHQADGSITANGSTLIGQNWSQSQVPRPPSGHLRIPGSPRRRRALCRLGEPSRRRWGQPARGQQHPREARRPQSRRVRGERISAPVPRRSRTNTQELVAYWKARGVNPTPDLVTTSGSGYDPDISQQDALVQIPMVSRATGLSARGAPAPRHQPDARGRARFLGHLVHRRTPAQRGSGQTEVSSTTISAVVARRRRWGPGRCCRSSRTNAPGSAPTSSSATATGVIVLRYHGSRSGARVRAGTPTWSSTARPRSTGAR